MYSVPLSCWRLSKKCAQKQESRQQREDTNADMTSSSKDVMAAVGKVHGHGHEQPQEHWGANGASDCAICGRSLQGCFAFVHGVYANDSTHFVAPSQFNILQHSQSRSNNSSSRDRHRDKKVSQWRAGKGVAEEQKVLTVPSSSCSQYEDAAAGRVNSRRVESSRVDSWPGLGWPGNH